MDLPDALLAMYGADGLEAFRARTLHVVQRLFGGELACHNEINLDSGESLSVLSEPIAEFPALRPAFFAHIEQHPSVQHHLRAHGGEPRAVKTSDFVGQRRWRNCGLYREFYRPLADVRYQLTIGQKIDDALVFFAISRRHRDFSEDERALMTSLRPHFVLAYRNAKCRAELRHLRGLAAERHDDMAGEAVVFALMTRFGLTRREGEVLQLIAEGMTNAEIATALHISLSTVKTRVENVFRRLNVDSRTEAALCVLRPPSSRHSHSSA